MLALFYMSDKGTTRECLLTPVHGRRPPLLIGIFGMIIFQVGVACAQNTYTVFICRFFAGVFGCAPLAVVGGALSDFWNPVQRGVTVGLYSMCTFVGPVAAPIAGGYIIESSLGWRWTEWLSVIMSEFSRSVKPRLGKPAHSKQLSSSGSLPFCGYPRHPTVESFRLVQRSVVSKPAIQPSALKQTRNESVLE